MDTSFSRNLTMLTDFYEMTMANGYFEEGMKDTVASFDLFFRTIPGGGGYAIMAGLSQAVEYIKELNFTDEDIEYILECVPKVVERLRAMSPLWNE